MDDPQTRVRASVFKCPSDLDAVKKRRDALLKCAPSWELCCEEFLHVQNICRWEGPAGPMQREPPTACNPPLHSPSPSLELMNGLNTINATFFSSPSLLRALLYLSEDF